MGISVAGGVFHNVGTADRCNACGGAHSVLVIISRCSGRRTDYRTGDRDRVGGDVEEN